MDVVVVESPAKAKTINKYLGHDYVVLASYGHVRDLPAKDGSVKPEADFAMTYVTDPKSTKHLADIAKALKGAKHLYLATDPDREGEAISWHVLQALEDRGATKGIKVKRVVFNEITRSAVVHAIQHPRDLDMDLVNAQQARRALDYLVGFTLSPVLWRKLPSARSAGRVQSVALRLICEREIEIEAFKAQEYWTIEVDFLTQGGGKLTARLTNVDGRKLEKFSLADSVSAHAVAARLNGAAGFKIADVATKPARRNPFPPFTTSTLQQEASRKLGLAAKRTMDLAQRLYEGVDIGGETVGLITYMRTDGVQIAEEAVAGARQVITEDFGKDYLPESPRQYKTKQKSAQEAHEAIRPTDLRRRPDQVARHLDEAQLKLYELIWKRTIASQMESARLERTTVDILSDKSDLGLRATGTVVLFPGFLRLYEEGRDDKVANGDEDSEDDRRLPKVAAGEALDREKVRPEQHFTEPPPRYTEATLVKRLEELGIGRPSTYASIISVLQERGYARLESKRFIPEDKGRLVTAFLTGFFERFFAYDFTANLEERLDEITEHQLDWKQVLREFWLQFSRTAETEGVPPETLLSVKQAYENLDKVIGSRAEIITFVDQALGPHFFPQTGDGRDPRACPSCQGGRLGIKVGKNGAFIGCSNYPDCRHTRPLAISNGEETASPADDGPKLLGQDPETGLPVTLRRGPFGHYVQLGEPVEKEKPKRASLPKSVPLDQVTLELALRLLALPRIVGDHPETGKPITAGLGRFGPYLEHDKVYVRLASAEEAIDIGLNRAVVLIAEKLAKGPGRRRGPEPLRSVGNHPDDGQPIQVMAGKYGPYVSHGGVNATLPNTVAPETVDLQTAIELLRERAARNPAKGARKSAGGKTAAPAAKAPAAKKVAKKKATKKPAAAAKHIVAKAAEPPKRKAAGAGE
jgi:DNA topoisomerase-1